MWADLRATLARTRTAEHDEAFRQELERLARRGLRAGAWLGLVAVGLFVGIYAAAGRPLAFAYGGPGAGATGLAKPLVLLDKLVLVGVCAGVLLVAGRVRLGGARALAAGALVLAAVASGLDDLASGNPTFEPAYVAVAFLLAVAAVPFRPAQTFGLGAALTLALWVSAEYVAGAVGLAVRPHQPGDYIQLTLLTVLLTGLNGLLYASRHEQFRAREEALRSREEAFRSREEALGAREEADRLRQHVEHLARTKDRFFADLSHEFRTPLTLLLGPLEDALDGRYGPLTPALRDRLGAMRAPVHRLRRSVDQLLDLSKLEAGRLQLQAWEHDLVAFARAQTALFRGLAERRELDLTFTASAERLAVWFDAERLGVVVTNLLSNALKFTDAGGTVRVHVDAESGAAVLAVRDSGRGIPPDRLPHVFDRYEGGAPGRDGQLGTGIGLALVKELAERHGGRVEVRSEPGFGAEFTVRLPLGDAHLAPDDRAPAAPERPVACALDPDVALPLAADPASPPALAADAPLVVVADDDAEVRAYVRDRLADRFRVAEAADGVEALRLVRAHVPALVISDVVMPGLDGFALCRAIKADDALAAVPVVLLTALADEARWPGLEAHADACVAKPFAGAELYQLVENLIEVRQVLLRRVRVPDWMGTRSPTVASHDAAFLARVEATVAAHLADSGFGVERLADEVGIGPKQLGRRLQRLTGLSAAGFIRAMRMERAAHLLREGGRQVKEVAQAVGYDDPPHFAKVFRQTHGVTPSEYARRHAADPDLDGAAPAG